jgi:phospholipid/cholesterol/gamma-HCH transport system permease protein
MIVVPLTLKPLPPVLFTDGVCRLSGDWNVQSVALSSEVARRRRALPAIAKVRSWDLSRVGHLDAVGAQLLWQHWQQRLPENLVLTTGQAALFDMLVSHPVGPPAAPPPFDLLAPVAQLGGAVLRAAENGRQMLTLFGVLLISFFGMLLRPLHGPWREISAQVYRTGAQALGITALVGFLIGIVLSYLSAQQLAAFGAGQYVVKLLGVSIVRELGPVLAAILVAGRSGSSITAQLGVMRVTQELDAMEVMGISHGQRLILPRVLALAFTMPLLVLWTDALALLGGMVAAKYELGLAMVWYAERLPDAIGIKNFWIGNVKGVTFGVWVALVACHFGFRIKPNTESLGRGVTTSVVTAITGVILIDAIFAIVINELDF